jgi:hypothetical protein
MVTVVFSPPVNEMNRFDCPTCPPLDSSWLLAARREAERKQPYYRVEWPGPAPKSWDNSVFSAPTNPSNAVSVTSQCTMDLINSGVCAGNYSCILGVGADRLPDSTAVDPEQFALGRVLHGRCVASRVQSKFGAY